MKINELDKEGLYLPIMEYFLSIQGEGYHTGKASFFIRIGGCDVGCHWCDVKESWNPEIHPLLSVKEVIEKIPPHIETVVLTGGEPSLYNLEKITYLLKEKGKKIHLETSGTGNFTGFFDWICLSPKKNQLPKQKFYETADELKVIIQNKTDFKFAEEQAKKVSPKIKLYLQPEWSKRKIMIPQIIEFIQNNPKWKISLQTHKYIGIP